MWYGAVTPKTPATRLAFAWYVTGVLVSSTVAALKLRTLDPLRSARAGLRAPAHGLRRLVVPVCRGPRLDAGARRALASAAPTSRDFSVTSS